MKPNTILTTFSLLIAVTHPLAAEPIFNSSFRDYPVDQPLLYSSSAIMEWAEQTQDSDKELYTVIRKDSRNLFGQGSSHPVLELSDQSNSNNTHFRVWPRSMKPSSQGYFRCTFAEPIDAEHQGQGFILRISRTPGNRETAFGLSIQNGSLYPCVSENVEPNGKALAKYKLNKAHELVVVFNNAESPVEYSEGELEAGTMDVWLDGECVAQGVLGCGALATGEPIRYFDFTSKSSPDTDRDFVGTLLIESISMGNLVEVPLP